MQHNILNFRGRRYYNTELLFYYIITNPVTDQGGRKKKVPLLFMARLAALVTCAYGKGKQQCRWQSLSKRNL